MKTIIVIAISVLCFVSGVQYIRSQAAKSVVQYMDLNLDVVN